MDRFVNRPRDGVVNGFPLTNNDQLVLFARNRTTQSTGVSVQATVYDPATDKTRTFTAVGPFSTAGTTFTSETAQFSSVGLFNDGEVLVAAMITSASITNPCQLWCAVELFRNGISVAWLCEGYLHGSHVPSWTSGSAIAPQLALANPSVQGALFTFHGSVTNGAGGAGTQSCEVAPAAGSRVEVLNSRVVNGDTVARVVQVEIDDASGGNVLAAYESVSANAGTSHEQPLGTVASAATATFGSGIRPIMIAGGNVYRMSVAAVALSQDSTYALLLRVWGAAPTITLAGASTPVLTVNTSRFETG